MARRMGFAKVRSIGYRIEIEIVCADGSLVWSEASNLVPCRLMAPAIETAEDVAANGWLTSVGRVPVLRARVLSPAGAEKHVATAQGAQREAAIARNAALLAQWAA